MKKTILQLLREFAVPFLIAIFWAGYNLYALPLDKRTLAQAITTFGGTFFFISWILGQIFRVQKQQKVEDKLHGIEANIRGLIAELREAVNDIVGNTTGGNGVCYMTGANILGGTSPTSILRSASKYALYDVRVEICDLEQFQREVDARVRISETRPTFRFEIILPDIAYPFSYGYPYDPLSPDSRSFNIFYFARNGHFSQLVRMKRVAGAWRTATKVLNGGPQPAYEWVEEGYPTEADGKIKWD